MGFITSKLLEERDFKGNRVHIEKEPKEQHGRIKYMKYQISQTKRNKCELNTYTKKQNFSN